MFDSQLSEFCVSFAENFGFFSRRHRTQKSLSWVAVGFTGGNCTPCTQYGMLSDVAQTLSPTLILQFSIRVPYPPCLSAREECTMSCALSIVKEA